MYSMPILSQEQMALLCLIRQALWSSEKELQEADWIRVEQLAKEQGVLWLLYAGARTFRSQIPADRIKAWRVSSTASVFYNGKINAIQNEVLGWMAERGIRTAVLKGTSCSRYYTFSEGRSLGDIDLLVDRENAQIVGKFLKEHGFVCPENDHSFHDGYYSKDATIEIHYAGTQVPDRKGGKIVNQTMEHFLDNVQMVKMDSIIFPALADQHQALMLLLHMERHMMEGGIGLRQLCDWMMFVQGSNALHWQNGSLQLLEKCGLLTYAKIITKTCVNYLGLDMGKAEWCKDADDKIVHLMIKDILHSGNMGRSNQESAGNLFAERSMLGQEKQTRIQNLIVHLSKLAYYHWPFTKKYKILLPFCWIYIPLRYWVRSLTGKRPKKRVSYAVKESNQRQKLYRSLHLYETKDN